MPLFKNYDPGRITLVFKGITVTGFHSGTFVKVSRDEDTWKKEKGAQGDGVRTRNRNRGGKIEFTTQGTSPSNSLLSALVITDERTGLGFGPGLVKDFNGDSSASFENGWLLKPADLEFADEHTPRDWVIDIDDLELVVGGSVV